MEVAIFGLVSIYAVIMLFVIVQHWKDFLELDRLNYEKYKQQYIAQSFDLPPHLVQQLEEATGCKVCEGRCCDKSNFERRMACGCMESRLHSESCYYYACKNCKTICECEPE